MKIQHFIALMMLPISIVNIGYTMDVDSMDVNSNDNINNENQTITDINNINTQMENINIDSESDSDSENKDTTKQIKELQEKEQGYIKRFKKNKTGRPCGRSN